MTQALARIHDEGLMAEATIEKCAEGMRVVFPNGYQLSIVWHFGAYSNVGRNTIQQGEKPTFETAVFNPDGDWFDVESMTKHDWESGSGDQVQGWQTYADILDTARKIATLGQVIEGECK